MQLGDVVALGGRLEDLTANMGLVGPEVPDAKALSIPLDQAEILVTNKSLEGRALKEFRHEEFAGQIQVIRMERGGVPHPLGAETQLKRFDVLFVAGLKSAVEKVAAALGKVSRASTATDLLTLSIGMILGLLIGSINVPLGGFKVGLGNAGGLLLSGSSSRRWSRGSGTSATRPMPRATSSRTWASSRSSESWASMPAHRSWRSSPGSWRSRYSSSGSSPAPSRHSSPGRSASTCSRSTRRS